MAGPFGAFRGRNIGILGGNVPGVQLKLDWEPSPVILAGQFAVLGASFRSFREPLNRSIRQVMIPSIRKNFDVEGRPSWEPLSEYTVTRREELGFSSGPILARTKALRRGATQINIWSVDKEKAYIGRLPERVGYGLVHQGGAAGGFSIRSGMSEAARLAILKSRKSGTGGGGEIPARPFLLIQEEDVDKIEKVFIQWVQERLARTGFGIGTNVAGALIKTIL